MKRKRSRRGRRKLLRLNQSRKKSPSQRRRHSHRKLTLLIRQRGPHFKLSSTKSKIKYRQVRIQQLKKLKRVAMQKLLLFIRKQPTFLKSRMKTSASSRRRLPSKRLQSSITLHIATARINTIRHRSITQPKSLKERSTSTTSWF